MRHNSRLFHLSASVAIGALLCNPTPPAWAQPASPPPAAQVAPPNQSLPDQWGGDPPARVGRIASETGAVSFRTSADTQWSAAVANYPVSSGNAFWTEPSARAELEISASRIDLSGQTEFDVTTLDADGLQAVVPQGELYLHLVDLAPNEAWSVQTPRGLVRLTEPGRYGIDSGGADRPTQVTVLEGAASISGPGLSLTVAANETATVDGNGPFHGTIGPGKRDAFLAARLGVERAPAQLPRPVEARLRYLPEIGDLAGTGEWGDAPDYGDVWYPPVAPGWVPYQNGQWAFVQPWGWTWVDSASWGFVPFHFGRWAHIGSRWGWVPGEARGAERPVYAPALVAFLGFSAGAAAGAAMPHGNVGWVPLGPGEPYHPWYRASGGYLRQINAGHVRDPAAINAPVAMNQFVNRGAATSVPAGVMLGSRFVRSAAQPMSPASFAAAHSVVGQQPIAPTTTTLGITPAVAHQLNLAGGSAPLRAAPGPIVRAQEPGAPHGPPPLAGPQGQALRPGVAGGPWPGAERAPNGQLPLIVPGVRPAGPPPGVGAPGAPRPEARPGGEPDIVRPAGIPPQQTPGGRPTGMFEPRGGNPSGAPPQQVVPGGLRPEGRPGPEPAQPPGVPPSQPPPGGRPTGMFEPRENRPPPPPAAPRPQAEPIPPSGPGGRLPSVEPPFRQAPPARAPEVREAPPQVAPPFAPHAPPPPPAPPPRIEAPRMPPPPPHVEAPRLAPPPPHMEPPRPPPPRPDQPPPRGPGER